MNTQNYLSGVELASTREFTAVVAGDRHQFLPQYSMFLTGLNVLKTIYGNEDIDTTTLATVQTSILASFDALKQTMVSQGYVTEDVENEEVLNKADRLQDDFIEFSRNGEERLEEHVHAFAESVIQAVRGHGFPLSEQQVMTRLEGLMIGFGSNLSEYGSAKEVHGVYRGGSEHRVLVDAFLDPKIERHVVFHELVHAISGSRIMRQNPSRTHSLRKNGIMGPRGNGVMSLEPLVDIVATSLDSGIHLDYEGSKYGLGYEWEVLDVFAKQTDYYDAFKIVFTSLNRNVPPKVFFDALFKADFDLFEVDQLAGTHALKTLYRAMRLGHGMEHTKNLHILENALKSGDHTVMGQVALKMATKQAESTDADLDDQFYALKRNTEDVADRIHKARQFRIKKA